MSKRTISLIFSLFTVAFVLVLLALYKPSSPESNVVPKSTAPLEPRAQTTLTFGDLISTQATKGAGISYQLPVVISTGENKVTAVQLELSYDPNVLTKMNVIAGIFFEKPVIFLDQIDEKGGRISYALGISGEAGSPRFGEAGKKGEGTVVVLTFETSSVRQETMLSFLPKTLVTAEGIAQTALRQAPSVKIMIGVDN